MGKQAERKSKSNAANPQAERQPTPEPASTLVATTFQQAQRTPSTLKPRQVLQLQQTVGNRAMSGVLPKPVSQIRRAVIQRGVLGKESSGFREELRDPNDTLESVSDYLREKLPSSGTIGTGVVVQILNFFDRLLNKNKQLYMIAVGIVSKGQTETLLGSVSMEQGQHYKKILEEFKTERMTVMGEASRGQQKWQGSDASNSYDSKDELLQPSGTDFDKWLLGQGPIPNSTATMNCWEAVMYMAFKAGVMPLSFIQSIHAEATNRGFEQYRTHMEKEGQMNAMENFWKGQGAFDGNYALQDTHFYASHLASEGAYSEALGGALGVLSAKDWDGTSEIPRGNLVFFNGFQSHVALSLGSIVDKKHQVMSLWTKPTKTTVKSDSIQLTTIEDIVTSMKKSVKITYTKAPWI